MSDPQRTFERFSPTTAWQPYYPLGTNPWNAEKVAHLFRRAAFGASWSTIQKATDSTPTAVVSQLISGPRDRHAFEDDYRKLRDGVTTSGEPKQYQALWLHRMLNSPHPLEERMTLFWHNHFATSNAKVADIKLMQRQHDVLRKHALGNFGEMLQAMTRDPAMIVWLDSATNKKGKPNENYAREVFELFSLGVGNYTEEDIKQAARALTGWSLRNGKAHFNPREFDDGEKTILGRKGNWGAGDVVRIALEQPACGRFLVRKLFRELVSESVDPSGDMIEPLAKEFRIRNYDIGWLVSKLLRSWVFYSPASINQKVKGPIDFLVGTAKMLEGRIGAGAIAGQSESLGQSLFYPPSVKGWDGGRDWITSSTLLRRQNITHELTRGRSPGHNADPADLAAKYNIKGERAFVTFFLKLFLQNPKHEAAKRIEKHLAETRRRLYRQFHTSTFIDRQLAREAAHLVATLPEYQLA